MPFAPRPVPATAPPAPGPFRPAANRLGIGQLAAVSNAATAALLASGRYPAVQRSTVQRDADQRPTVQRDAVQRPTVQRDAVQRDAGQPAAADLAWIDGRPPDNTADCVTFLRNVETLHAAVQARPAQFDAHHAEEIRARDYSDPRAGYEPEAGCPPPADRWIELKDSYKYAGLGSWFDFHVAELGDVGCADPIRLRSHAEGLRSKLVLIRQLERQAQWYERQWHLYLARRQNGIDDCGSPPVEAFRPEIPPVSPVHVLTMIAVCLLVVGMLLSLLR